MSSQNIQGFLPITLWACRADVGHFGETELVFEEYLNYIRSRDKGCFMKIINIFKWHLS